MTALSSFGLAVRIALFAAVSSIEVFTSKELQAKNGTDTRLKCTFSSSEPLGDEVTVSWTFHPLSGGSAEHDELLIYGTAGAVHITFEPSVGSICWNALERYSDVYCGVSIASNKVFYYKREPYPPNKGRFQNRAVWDGNIKRSDGSIIIRNIQQTDNGTYLCQVTNVPDVHGEMGEIMLCVVDQVKFSEIMLLAVIIGVGSAVIILIVIVVVLFRYYRKQRTRSTAVSVMECREKLNDKSHDMTINA